MSPETFRRGGIRRPGCAWLLVVLVTAVLFFTSHAQALWQVKQVASVDRGIPGTSGYIVPFRSSSGAPPQFAIQADMPGGFYGLHFYQYVPVNRYVLQKVDTAQADTISTGRLLPWAAGDVDGDSAVDLIGNNVEEYPAVFYLLASMYEMTGGRSVPDSLVWCGRYDSLIAFSWEPFYITDLDRDGRNEIALREDARGGQVVIFECVADDSLRLVTKVPSPKGYRLAFGDFDQDGQTEFATAGLSSYNAVSVFKCVGDDQYVFWDSTQIARPNGHDIFDARNIDGAHRATFFVSFASANGNVWLYQFEPMQGTRGYQAFGVDSTSVPGPGIAARSVCGDIDGDGIEEILWSCGTQIRASRCTGPHQYERIWTWWNGPHACNLNVYDMNSNGYNEILMSGGERTVIFEIEAIKVLTPNNRTSQHPGDTMLIRWQTFDPPRCDSVSLFLRKDTAWSLDTIGTGLAPTESSLVWTVPELRSDSCRIVAIAYGPGWQYDESDSCFSIVPAGVVEVPLRAVLTTGLTGVLPQPVVSDARVRFELAAPGHVRLSVLDAAGRSMATLADGRFQPGVHTRTWEVRDAPAGVYFVRFEAGGRNETRKLVVR